MNVEHLEEMINLHYKDKQYKNRGAIILVHVGGHVSENIYKIKEIAKNNNLLLIEDCAHAHGSKIDGVHVGSFGITSAYSFFLTKTNSGFYKYILRINDITKSFDYSKFKSYMKKNGINLPYNVYNRLIVNEPYLNKIKCIKNLNDNFVKANILKNSHVCYQYMKA